MSAMHAIDSSATREVTVVGAGIIGIVTAVHLQREGHRVTVVDRDDPGNGASFGNAGSIAPSSILPMAMPGVLRNLPNWLRDPLGPLTISWRLLPRLLPWFLHFRRACDPARARRAASALRALNAAAVEAYAELLAAAGAPELLRREGMLHVYRSEGGFAASAFGRQLRMDNGCAVEVADSHRIRELAPGLSPAYRWGFYLPDNAHVRNPARVVEVLARHFADNGGRIERAHVKGFTMDANGPVALQTDAGAVPVGHVVLAAGHASGALASKAGTRVPLAPERGYHIEIPQARPLQHCPVTDGEARCVATPMEGGLRIAGTSEFNAAQAPPDWARAEALARNAAAMFPGLQTAGHGRWMGVRPSTPDSAPVIGRSPVYRRLYFAFGHGHWGLMAAPATARILADLVAGRTPAIDIAPFRPDRFSLTAA